MNVEALRDFCLSLGDDVEEKMPFTKFNSAQSVLVFYTCGHMFCYFDIDDFQVVTLKCQPERIMELKERNSCVTNPYNADKRYWIGLHIREAEDTLARELVRNSFEIVRMKYRKR